MQDYDEVRFVRDQIDSSTLESRDDILVRLLEQGWSTLEVQKQ